MNITPVTTADENASFFLAHPRRHYAAADTIAAGSIDKPAATAAGWSGSAKSSVATRQGRSG